MSTGRDRRRSDERRAKTRARKIVKSWLGGDCADNPRMIGKVAHTPHSCSCYMCGNPRRHRKGSGRLTIQEQKVVDTEDA
jgi:hypothetical protein